jgi:catechol 2,3-dioxygenase-like lactoylglutathione lyase family enzyme
MPIPETNFDPPFNITRASHLVFTVRDLAASRAFYTEVLGLVVSDEDADTLWLRGIEERAHHSLTLKRTADVPMCERVGFRVFTDDDLELAQHVAGAAHSSSWHLTPTGRSAPRGVNRTLPFQGSGRRADRVSSCRSRALTLTATPALPHFTH